MAGMDSLRGRTGRRLELAEAHKLAAQRSASEAYSAALRDGKSKDDAIAASRQAWGKTAYALAGVAPETTLDRVKSTLKAALDAAKEWEAERTTERQLALEAYGWDSPQHDATFDGALKSGTLVDLLTRGSYMFSKDAE
jgi:hypothetical protein